MPAAQLHDLNQHIATVVSALPKATAVDQLLPVLTEAGSELPAGWISALTQLELQHSETLMCSLDGICGATDLCLRALLAHALADEEDGVHYRQLTKRVNRRLAPGQAVGAGSILKRLDHPLFLRKDSGIYSLAALEGQTP